MGGKGGCKVVPRNFLSDSSLIVQTLYPNLHHHRFTSLPPHLPLSPSSVFRLPSPPPLAPNPTRVPTHTHFPHAPIHLIPSHPIPILSIPRPSYILMQPTPILSLIFSSPTHPHSFTSMPPPHTLSSIDPFRLISYLPTYLTLVYPSRALSAWMVAGACCVGWEILGVVHRCGKGRGEEVVRTAGGRLAW